MRRNVTHHAAKNLGDMTTCPHEAQLERRQVETDSPEPLGAQRRTIAWDRGCERLAGKHKVGQRLRVAPTQRSTPTEWTETFLYDQFASMIKI